MARLKARLIETLSQLRKQTLSRTESYRLQAEIEDLETGARTYWDGARKDDPPDGWTPPPTTPIPEPVPKSIQAKYVQAEHDLMWLAEHGGLNMSAGILAAMRKDIEFGEKS